MVVFGKSPAVIRAIYEKFVFSESAPLLPRDSQLPWRHPDRFIESGQGWEQSIAISDTEREAKAMWTSPENLQHKYFYVTRIIYDDVFGNQHELGFCYCAPATGGAGLKYGGAEYNFHRQRKEEERF